MAAHGAAVAASGPTGSHSDTAAGATAAAAGTGGTASGIGAASTAACKSHIGAAAGVAAGTVLQQRQPNAGAGHGVHLDASEVSQGPPPWALQQLAQHLRAALKLNLFNVDILVPGEQQQEEKQQQEREKEREKQWRQQQEGQWHEQQQHQEQETQWQQQQQQEERKKHWQQQQEQGGPGGPQGVRGGHEEVKLAGVAERVLGDGCEQKGSQQQHLVQNEGCEGPLLPGCLNQPGLEEDQQEKGHYVKVKHGRTKQLVVVDINYFPGYDKVPGAEPLLASFLAGSVVG